MKIFIVNPFFCIDFCKSARWFCRSRGRVQRHPDYLLEAVAQLEQDGHICRFIDAACKNLPHQEVLEVVGDFQPDMVVIQTTTPSIYSDLDFAFGCKQLLKDKVRIVLVGAHVSTEPEDTFSIGRDCFDVIAIGEYDLTLKELASGKDLSEVRGICYLQNGRLVKNTNQQLIENLDELEFPAWQHIDPYDYHDAGKLYPFLTLLGSRGCEGTCSFCLFPQLMYGRRQRVKSPQRILDEVEYDYKLFPRLKEIMFEDDTLVSFSNRARLEELCLKIQRRNLRFVWSANARPDFVDEKLFLLMKKSGCRMLCVGFESASEKLLAVLGKPLNLETMKGFSRAARKAGLRLHGCFMFGAPGETKESCLATIDFAQSLPLDSVQFSGVCPYPGTALYCWAKAKGFLLPRTWQEWVDKNGEQVTVLEYPQLKKEEIDHFIDQGLCRFYFRPKKILQAFLFWTRSPAELKSKLYGVFRYLWYLIGKR